MLPGNWYHCKGAESVTKDGRTGRELNLSKSTVKRALADLEKAGRIRKECRKRENGGTSSNYYFL